MFSKLFGSKKKEVHKSDYNGQPLAETFSFLGADIHSHFVPGIDDGAQTVDDSIALLKRMQDMGYTRIVTTPHIKVDHYPNTPATINGGLAELKQAMSEHGITMPVKAAAEYYIDDYFLQILEEQQLLTIYNNELLVEISFMFEPIQFNEILFKIQSKGYRPILAHPERYLYYHQNIEKYSELKDRGCYLQLNLNSLTGYYGKPVKQIAHKLLEMGMYDYCGSDMHHEKHADVLHSIMVRPELMGLLQQQPFRNNMVQV